MLIALMTFAANASATPVHLRCEYMENPLGIDIAAPRLSWQSESTERNWKQAAYEVLVASSSDRLQPGQADVWDSGRTVSDESVGIAYNGPALESRKRYYWKVRVWDASGHVSDSAEEAWWEMGLLHPGDWTAKWIAWRNPEDEADRAGIHWIWAQGQDPLATIPKTAAKFQVTLSLPEKPKQAEFLIAVHGAYKATVNGHEVGNKSRWAAFDRRDIADELIVGQNQIEVEVTSPPAPEFGPGKGATTTVGGFAALIKVTNPNGRLDRLATGERWKARLESDSEWHPAQVAGDLSDQRFGNPGPLPQPAAYLRRNLEIARPVERARLYVTALGTYRVFLNGKRVGSDVLTPAFTDYRKRVLYQTYDVTNQIVSGANVIGALLGDGWYGSPLTWVGAYFFTPPDRFLAQLELEYADGSRDTVVTDDSWKAAPSPIVESQIYSGEYYDAREEKTGWNTSQVNDSAWKSAVVADAPSLAVTG